MWEKTQETQYPPILPGTEEMKAALTPPVTPREKQRPNYILRVQVFLCLLATAVVLILDYAAPELYRQCSEAFYKALESGVELNGQEVVTKGDANNAPDPGVPAENVVGEVVATLSGVGLFFEWVKTTQGIVCVVLLAGIIVDISYGFIDPRIRMGAK